MKFPQPFIDEVRSAADIVTVISDYVSLRKAGTSYKGLCPFHGEKTPSFNVNRDRGFFHCFGCGVGGDVFKFIELKEQVGFQDAVRQLAQRFGVPVPEMESGDGARTARPSASRCSRSTRSPTAYFREQLARRRRRASATTCWRIAASRPRDRASACSSATPRRAAMPCASGW